MGLKSRIVGRGKQLVQRPAVMRWVSDDRVMKAAEGVMDARSRVKLAWHMLKNGHALPAVDPALDDSLGETIDGATSNGSSNALNNGSGHVARNGARNGSGNGSGNGSSNGSGHGLANGNGVAHVSGGVSPAQAPRRVPTNGATYETDNGMETALRERTGLSNVGGRDVFEKCYQFTTADNARKAGL